MIMYCPAVLDYSPLQQGLRLGVTNPANSPLAVLDYSPLQQGLRLTSPFFPTEIADIMY